MLGPGDHFDRHYLIDKRIAVAGAGICYRAFETDHDSKPIGPALAIKVLYTSRDSGPYLRRLAAEAQILQDLAHQHIVECRGFVNRLGHNPYLITRFEEGGSLYDHIRHVGAVPIPVAAIVIRQVLLALDVAHQRGVVHRDLKPQNVLIRRHVSRDEVPHALVADFGIAKVAGTLNEGLTQVGTFVGTPEFAAPEQFLGEPPGPATDVFAAGGLLYFMLTGTPPVRFSHRTDSGTSLRELLQQIPPKVPSTAGSPEDCQAMEQLLAGMMRKEMAGRWTGQQIVAFLSRFGDSEPLRGDGDTLPLTGQGEHHTLVAGDFGFDDDPVEQSTEGHPADLAVGEHPTMSPQTVDFDDDDDDDDDLVPPPAMPPAPATAAPATPAASRPNRMRLPRRTEEMKIAQLDAEPSGAMSLDDLFGGGTSDSETSEDSRSELSLDDLFADPTDDVSDPTPTPASRASTPPPAPKRPEPEPIRDWIPLQLTRMPTPLPDDTVELLRLMGGVAPADREAISKALEGRNDLSSKLNGYRTGSDPAAGCGIGLTIGLQGWTGCANSARRMLQDPDPGVRSCAAEAVGAVGSASMLTSLSRMLTDSEPQVRAAAARALVVAGQKGHQSLVKGWLAPLENDADPAIRATWKQAISDLI